MDEPESFVSDQRRYNTRLGIVLFAIYLALYLGFVLINAFAATVMETPVVAGLNLAIVYGFGLIVAALVMALVYGAMCKNEPDASKSDSAKVIATESNDSVSTESGPQSGDVQ